MKSRSFLLLVECFRSDSLFLIHGEFILTFSLSFGPDQAFLHWRFLQFIRVNFWFFIIGWNHLKGFVLLYIRLCELQDSFSSLFNLIHECGMVLGIAHLAVEVIASVSLFREFKDWSYFILCQASRCEVYVLKPVIMQRV
jgi:hypothetical protein